MEKPDALEKRIKRQVTARQHRFFVVVSPGLGPVCRAELNLLFGGEKTLIDEDGGIAFDGPVTDVYRANLHLRTASRILMRLTSFDATDFKTLETKTEALPWELYLDPAAPLDVQVTVKKSRLYHSGAVDQRVREAIGRRLGPFGASGMTQTVYVRAVQDRFELSLDSSGDLLYRRGLKTVGGSAPLRETLAAGMLMAAGYDGRRPLLDPMCGSGSFSLEAALIARNIPPGRYRRFAFEHWPCFREGAFRQIRREAEAGINQTPSAPIVASDRDTGACERLSAQVLSVGLGDLIRVQCRDVLDPDPEIVAGPPGIIMANPPYGLRLGTRRNSLSLIRDFLALAGRSYRGWTLGLLSPFDVRTLNPAFPLTSHRLFHGGLSLFFLTGPIPSAPIR
ncbi:RNA methyltransferase [Desulfatiferula olefinivorans]